MPSAKFNLDLDDKPAIPQENPIVKTDIDAPVPENKPLESKKLDFETICLPIPTYDEEGNNIIVTKSLEECTAEDIISWLCTVMSVSRELAEKLIGVKDRKEFNNTIKNKTYVFNTVVSLHENRWLFGLGKPSVEKNN